MHSEQEQEIVHLTRKELHDLFEEDKGAELEDYYIYQRLVPLEAYYDIMEDKGLEEIRQDEENEEN